MKISIKDYLSKLFTFDEWVIGFANLEPKSLIEKKYIDNYNVIWVKNPSKLTYRADAFYIKINDKTYLIFEEYSQIKKRGTIAIAEIENNRLTNKKTLIDDKKHLSYPFLFKDHKEIFIICESYKSGKTTLYKLDQQKLEIEKVKEIFTEFGVVDPIIIFHNNKYWLFYSKPSKPNEELYIAYSESLVGDYIQHPKNPIKICKKSSRNAGEIFTINNELYRPSQNCENVYGEKISLNKIIKMDEQNYIEELCSEILPSKKFPKILRIHNLAISESYIVIDGFRKSYFIFKPLISLFRNFIRISNKLLNAKKFV